jgi:hypothetical protein
VEEMVETLDVTEILERSVIGDMGHPAS